MWQKIKDYAALAAVAILGVIAAIFGTNSYIESKRRKDKLLDMQDFISKRNKQLREERDKAEMAHQKEALDDLVRETEESINADNSTNLAEYLNGSSDSSKARGDR